MRQTLSRKAFYSLLLAMEAVILAAAIGLALYREVDLTAEIRRSTNLFPLVLAFVSGSLAGFIPYLMSRTPLLRKTYQAIIKGLLGFRLNIWDCLLISLLAGVCEEVLFRGVLQPWWGIWITSLVFTLIHGYGNPRNWRKLLFGVFTFGISLAAGLFYDRYGLTPAMVFHFCCDAVSYLIIMLMQKKQAPNPG